MKNRVKCIAAILLLSILITLNGCARQAGTKPAANATEITATAPMELETTQAPVTSTLTSTSKPVSASLVVKTLSGTSIPPIVLTQVTPTETSTAEPTTNTKYFPDAQVRIIEPADLSQLASPVTVQAVVFPGAGNLVHVQLIGEDGRLIHDRVMKMVKSDSGWVNLEEEIKFEINTGGESAMLVITTNDEFGRRIAQSASQLFLIQIGKSDVQTNDFATQPFVISTPKKESIVKSGVVHVEGYAHAFNANPIILELLTESGGVMETLVVKLPRNAPTLEYVPFSADIPYSVDIETPVRLSIRQRSTLIPSIDVALSSELILLQP